MFLRGFEIGLVHALHGMRPGALASGENSVGFCGSLPSMTLMRSIIVAMVRFPSIPSGADVDNDRGRLDRADHFADAAADALFEHDGTAALEAIGAR